MSTQDMSLKNLLLALPFTDEQLSRETNLSVEVIQQIKAGDYKPNDANVAVMTGYIDRLCVKLMEHLVCTSDMPTWFEVSDSPIAPRLISDTGKETLAYRISHTD